jgi:hypothetical protein
MSAKTTFKKVGIMERASHKIFENANGEFGRFGKTVKEIIKSQKENASH